MELYITDKGENTDSVRQELKLRQENGAENVKRIFLAKKTGKELTR